MIAVDHSTVDFVVDDENQFQILSVTYNGQKYTNADYLSKYNDFVADAIKFLKPVVKEKIAEYSRRPDMIEYREAQAKLKEEQLEKRTLTVQAREQLLEFQAQAIDIESKILEEEKLGNNQHELLQWAGENIFLFKWTGIVFAILFILWLLLRIVLQ